MLLKKEVLIKGVEINRYYDKSLIKRRVYLQRHKYKFIILVQ